PLTAADESKTGCVADDTPDCTDLTLNVLADTDPDTDEQQNTLKDAIDALNNARDMVPDVDGKEDTQGIQAPNLDVAVGEAGAGTAEQRNAQVQYDLLVAAAKKAALEAAEDAFEPEELTAAVEAADAMPRDASTAGQNIKVERDAWMVSGKIKMGGPIDFRFSYMDADDLEVSCGSCSGDWDETAADAWNVGVFYTMPAGTELRLTYSEVSNDDNGTYGQGISGTGLGSPGAEIEMFAVGIVHWFD
ncbi:MAG: porin, partial [Gammaproteobacteria bacterium]|nr:porin [Gammaproteobacteria bacterium]